VRASALWVLGCILRVRRVLTIQVAAFSLLAFDGFLLPDRACIVDGVVVIAFALVLSGCGLRRFFSLTLRVCLHMIVLVMLVRATSLVAPSDGSWKVAGQREIRLVSLFLHPGIGLLVAIFVVGVLFSLILIVSMRSGESVISQCV
jgi:hypothetical protein